MLSNFGALALLAAFVLVLLLGLGLWLMLSVDGQNAELGRKIVEIVVQTAAVTVAGGILIQAYLKWHSRETGLNEFRKAVLDSLVKGYVNTKRLRRLLRATAKQDGISTTDNPWTAVPVAHYEKYLEELNQTQLDFEVLNRRVQVFATAFQRSDALVTYVKEMSEYLDALVSEYERFRARIQPYSDQVRLDTLPVLKGFLFRKSESTFSSFTAPFHQAVQVIQASSLRVTM